MLKHSMDEVYRYFKDNIKKVYVDSENKIETLKEYLEHGYRDNCYYYSTYTIMGLKPDDFLVRGNISLYEWKNYHHGWIEFMYNRVEYVYDSRINEVIPKCEWYNRFNPRIDYKKTQREILDEFLNENCAYKIEDWMWQFKGIVCNEVKNEITYPKYMNYDRNNGYVPMALSLGRINICSTNKEVTMFIAHNSFSG